MGRGAEQKRSLSLGRENGGRGECINHCGSLHFSGLAAWATKGECRRVQCFGTLFSFLLRLVQLFLSAVFSFSVANLSLTAQTESTCVITSPGRKLRTPGGYEVRSYGANNIVDWLQRQNENVPCRCAGEVTAEPPLAHCARCGVLVCFTHLISWGRLFAELEENLEGYRDSVLRQQVVEGGAGRPRGGLKRCEWLYPIGFGFFLCPHLSVVFCFLLLHFSASGLF